MKKLIKILLFIPVILIAAIVLFEIFGAVFNSCAASVQTKKLKNDVIGLIPDCEIIDTYSKTGNTSGTGNHVDMLSVIVFRTDKSRDEITDELREKYEGDLRWCEVLELDAVKKAHEEASYLYPFYDQLNLPENSTDCYVLSFCRNAPFADNIVGH